MSALQDIPTDVLIPPAPRDADVIRLLITVKVNRAGMAVYRQRYPDFKSETRAETFIREAIVAWDFEALLAAGFETEARRI